MNIEIMNTVIWVLVGLYGIVFIILLIKILYKDIQRRRRVYPVLEQPTIDKVNSGILK